MTRRAQCDRVSLCRYNAVLSDDKDKFQESETNQITTGLDSNVTAAIVFFVCHIVNPNPAVSKIFVIDWEKRFPSLRSLLIS